MIFGHHPCGVVLIGPLTALCARLKRCREGDTPWRGKQTDHMCRTEQPLRSPPIDAAYGSDFRLFGGRSWATLAHKGSGRKCGMFTPPQNRLRAGLPDPLADRPHEAGAEWGLRPPKGRHGVGSIFFTGGESWVPGRSARSDILRVVLCTGPRKIIVGH